MKSNRSDLKIMALCVAGAAAGIALFRAVSRMVHDRGKGSEKLHAADKKASDLARSHRSNNKTAFFRGVTALGSAPVIAMIGGGWFLWSVATKRHRIAAFAACLCSVCGAMTTFVLKRVYRRSRPDENHLSEAPGYSFPSGHTLSAAAFYSYMSWFFLRCRSGQNIAGKALAALTALVIPLVGLSRIYLGVHYVSDVFGGIIAGTSWAALFTGISNALGEDYE